MSENRLRIRLEKLAQLTDNACTERLGVWLAGDAAAERQVRDDAEAGRLLWQDAHLEALAGMQALAGGDTEAADQHRWIAESFVLKVLESRLRPADKNALGQPAQRRGRPRKRAK